MLSKTKGNIAEIHAIAYFTRNEYSIFTPLGSVKDVDFVAIKNHKTVRVQVKYAGFYPPTNRCIATLRVMGGNQSYYTAKKYSDNAFDLLYVYTARDESYLIPWRQLKIRSSINIDSPIYHKFRIMQG